MSALVAQGARPRSSSRGNGPLRGSVRSSGVRLGTGDRPPPRGPALNGTRGEARGARRTSPSATRGDGQAGRQTSPGRSRGDGRLERHTSPGETRTRGSQRHLKPPPVQTNDRHKPWRNPASLNADFQSHAGKVTNSKTASWRNPPFEDLRVYNRQMNDLFQTLKQNRDKERKQAIKDGFLADPDKPTTLANAITPVGTCQDMCPEFERVERIVQLMVDGREKTSPSPDAKDKVPFEDIMVKRFRRSAAGYDEQLPSDIRPPAVLQKTLNYLFDQVVGGPEPLAVVHKFVWDRTRGIRNDFSIQQVTKVEDLKIAIDCFERIARFHILSLHQLSKPSSDNADFDPHQEREQLNNTILSLHYYYEDSRHKLTSPNEAEFRAYRIIFEIQDQRPDVEDRLQSLPKSILQDRRIQTALKLHAAAGNTADEQGPLRPRIRFLTAQANPGGFWNLVQSNAVSYLMACVAEVYFNLVRRTALEAIWKAYKQKRGGSAVIEDWTLDDLTSALGFDDEEATRAFCEEHEFTIGDRASGGYYIDLGSVSGGNLTDQNPRRRQVFSRSLVEHKRLGRTLPAVINGMTASEAQSQGFVEDTTDAETASNANSESLFVDADSDDDHMHSRSRSASPHKQRLTSSATTQFNPSVAPFNPFQKPPLKPLAESSPFQNSSFGKPSFSTSTPAAQTNSKPSLSFNAQPAAQLESNPFLNNNSAKFDFSGAKKADQAGDLVKTDSVLPNKALPAFDFGAALSAPKSTNESRKVAKALFTNPPDSKSSVFGIPSSTNHSSPPPTSVTTSQPAVSSVIAKAEPPKSIFDQPKAPSPAPTFSFGTSPLFQTYANKQGSTIKTDIAPSPPETTTSQPSIFPTSSTPKIISPTSDVKDDGNLSTQPKQSTSFFPTNLTDASSTKPSETSTKTETTSPFAPQATPTFPQPKLDFTLPQSQPNLSSKPSAEDLFKPKLPPATSQSFVFPSAAPSPPKSTQAGIGESFSLSKISAPSGSTATDLQPKVSPLPKEKSLDPRSIALDNLANSMMLEEGGLLQQFIEFTVEPIIQSSILQLEDEESWKEARECRLILLRKKYFKRWRAIAWNLALMSKGRNRRRNLAQSVQDLARSASRSSSGANALFGPSVSEIERTGIGHGNSAGMMAPPPRAGQKRTSLPTGLDNDQLQVGTAKGSKRKREDAMVADDYRTPKPTKISHKRSRTVGDAMSAPPHGLSHSSRKSRIDVSRVPQGSLLNDILMKQARRLAPAAKSDTTQTDYFRLKALGIDPDTPVIPATKKRPRAESQISAGSTSIEKSPAYIKSTSQLDPRSQSPLAKPPETAQDDDEEFFAQIRSVREALAESEQWMHNERQSIERSATPQQPSCSPPTIETPAQRRLREIKERGPTPSRTELRLRAMGDKALLPKGFWDGEGMGLSLNKGKGKKEEPVPMIRANGLMAISQMNGVIEHDAGRVGREESKKGASFEDAIEL